MSPVAEAALAATLKAIDDSAPAVLDADDDLREYLLEGMVSTMHWVQGITKFRCTKENAAGAAAALSALGIIAENGAKVLVSEDKEDIVL